MMKIKVQDDDAVVLEISGVLTKDDYHHVVPEVERLIEKYGQLRAMVELSDFHGWQPAALVEELSFDLRHRSDFSKLAILGDDESQKLLSKIAAPIFSGETKFFSKSEVADAMGWLAN